MNNSFRFIGDYNAARKGRVGQRIKRRIAGKIAGRIMGREL